MDRGALWVERLAFVCLIAFSSATFMGIAQGSLASSGAVVPLANLKCLPLAMSWRAWCAVHSPSIRSQRNLATDINKSHEKTRPGCHCRHYKWDSGCLAVLLGWAVTSVAGAVLAHARHRRYE
ncbi:MAG: hypothetical protein F4145_05525 [Boseongicola sp. SB0675_bin_26]|nr:hypothetical protein [Boseongicola sp. SB0675_bin_26]